MAATRHVCFLVLLLGMLSSLAAADSLDLRNGRHLHGKYLGGTAGVIAFSSNGAVQYFSVKEVLAVVFADEDDATENLLPQNFNPASDCGGASTSRTDLRIRHSDSRQAPVRTGQAIATGCTATRIEVREQ